ncbi:MAG: hypothetical protein WKF84_06280 [Pyrinomonadaceae bacterium]
MKFKTPMARWRDCRSYLSMPKHHKLKIISIADLISYRLKHDRLSLSRSRDKVTDVNLGSLKFMAYRHTLDNTEHVAIVKGDPATFKDEPVMVRMHSECLTGDALGSLRCDCRIATASCSEND